MVGRLNFHFFVGKIGYHSIFLIERNTMLSKLGNCSMTNQPKLEVIEEKRKVSNIVMDSNKLKPSSGRGVMYLSPLTFFANSKKTASRNTINFVVADEACFIYKRCIQDVICIHSI